MRLYSLGLARRRAAVVVNDAGIIRNEHPRAAHMDFYRPAGR
jgi:hypothetical protein